LLTDEFVDLARTQTTGFGSVRYG